MPEINILQNKQDGTLWADLPGGQLQQVTPEQARAIRENRSGVSNLLQSGLEEGSRVLTGLASNILPGGYDRQLAEQQYRQRTEEMQGRAMVSPTSTFAGQALPAVALGAATAGAGLPAIMAAEAAYGAGAMAENPLAGAALGAAVPGVFAGARAALPVVSEAIQNATGVPMMGIAGGGRTGGRMADRVAQQIDAAAPEGTAPAARVLAGTNTAQELEQMGAQLAPWQRMALEATDRGQFAAAERARWTAKVAGNDFPEAMASQRYAFTDLIKRELGMEGVENLTPRMVAQGLETEGKAIGQFRQARGLTQLEDTQLSAIRQTVDEANTTHQAALKNILSDLENSAAKNDGSIAPADLNSAIRRLNNLSAPGSDPARIADAKQVLRELEAAIEKKLNPAEREMYRQAMYRYKVLKALDKPGALSADGTANPVSFGRNWDKATAQTLRGQDTLGKAADTFAAIQVIRENPGTTLQRVFAQAPAKAASLGTSAALGAAGLSAFGGLI